MLLKSQNKLSDISIQVGESRNHLSLFLARFILGAIVKVCRSPAKQTKLVSLETPSLPPKQTKIRTSGFNSQINMYVNTIWSPNCDFFETPPSRQTNFVRFNGLLRTFAIVPYRSFFFAHFLSSSKIEKITFTTNIWLLRNGYFQMEQTLSRGAIDKFPWTGPGSRKRRVNQWPSYSKI